MLAGSARAQTVSMTWIGQACFYIQAENGPMVVVDPPAASVGYTLPTTPADVVTISHNHTDHNASASVRGNFALVDGRPTTQRTETAAAGLSFIQIPGFHDNTNGATRGPNTIMVWRQGDLKFAHFGDFGQDAPTDAQLADLHDIDVMMVAGGGFFTLEPPQVAALVAQIKPRVAILMHWRTAIGGPAQLATLPAVSNPFPDIRYKPSMVKVSRATLPESTQVWVMEPVADATAVNLAGATPGAPVAAGALAAVQGTFSGSTTGTASAFPVPTKIDQTEVFIGNAAVPLLYVSPSQVNFQVPGALAAGQNAIEVRVGGQRVARGTITTVPHGPGLFTATDQDGRVGRVRRGEILTIYGSGQGAVSPPATDGTVAEWFVPLSRTPSDPVVTIAGKGVPVLYSGLAPFWIGLWQIDVQIPSDLPTGENQDMVAFFEPNLVSNTLKLTIESARE
jgi:uncharacterized protein (TIGR03437 family)